MGRAAIIKPAITISLTALALAPGVLKTTIPSSEARSIGMLFTPAPARAIASKLSLKVKSWIFLLLNKIASASCVSFKLYSFLFRRSNPSVAIILKV